MKKIGLTLSLVIFVSVSAYAQDAFFSDSLRKELKQYLVDNAYAGNPDLYDAGNMSIYNEINGENIYDNPESGKYMYGIYSFSEHSFPYFGEILIRCNNEYEILGMSGVWKGESFLDIMKRLIAYVERHSGIPQTLLYLYVDVVSRIYYLNAHLEEEFGVHEYEDRPNDAIYHFFVKLLEDKPDTVVE